MFAWDKKLNGNGSSVSDSGSNDWTDSQLKDILNGIYYESGSGDCTNISNNTACDFTGNRGLSDVSSMIDKDVIWNLGGWETHNLKASKFYEKERGTTVYSNSVHNITRPSEWSSVTNVGENFNGIGLIYPSDYVYASYSGSEERETCFEEELYNWNTSSSNGCGQHSWLKTSNKSWTMMPRSSTSDDVALILSTGNVRLDLEVDSRLYDTWPTLYLKPSVKILPNDNLETYGSLSNPFILG